VCLSYIYIYDAWFLKVKYHNMKTYGGMEHQSCIHNLAVRWCDLAQVKPATLSVGKEILVPTMQAVPD
jgi:hypothetical protein